MMIIKMAGGEPTAAADINLHMKSFIKYQYAVFIFFLFAQNIFAQSYFFRHITTHNGLAGEDAIGFAQDSKGFIWIATDNGLQRFDGENFVTYRHNDKDSNSLSNDETLRPLFDKENNLWLNDFVSSVNIFNIYTGKTIKINPNTSTKEKPDDLFISYCNDAKGTMWLTSHRALYRYNYAKKKAEKIGAYPDSLLSYNIWGMACDTATGNIWISTKFRVIEYNRSQNIFFDFHYNPEHSAVFNLHSEPNCIYIDSRRNLWFSTWQGELFRYNLSSHFLKQYYLTTTLRLNPNKMAGGIVEDKNGNIWIGANSSDIFYYNPGKDSLQLVSKQFIEKPSSGQTDIHSMFCDRENNIWIATDFGVYYFNPARQKIYAVSNDPFNTFSLPASQVETFGESKDGFIWVSSRDGGGISVFDKHMHLLKRLYYQGDTKYKTYKDIEILACCDDTSGKFWMASVNRLIRYDPLTKEIKTWVTPELNFFVHSMVCDEDGNIWIGGGNTIVKFNSVTGLKKVFTGFTAQYINKPEEIWDLLIDAHNNIWVATTGDGIFHFDKQTGNFDVSFTHNEKDIHSLCNDLCVCLAPYDDSIVLIGTANGLSFFNTNNKQFNTLNNTDGFASNLIHGVSTDKYGNIFISTVNGLYKIDCKTKVYTHYDYDDGIIDNQFYTKIYRLHDGRMLAGGLNSFIYFNPEDLKETYAPPDVQLTGFKIFDRQYSAESLLDSSNTFHLNFDQNFITIQYAALYYNAPADIHYYYRLDGVDKNWVNAGNARYATYTGVDEGNYTFEVKCMNDDGIACKNITRLRINIATPYYKSWWFILLCAVALAAMVYAAYDYRLRTRRNLAVIRKRIASDLHDDIGSTLNSISVYSEVAGQQLQSNTGQAKTILEKMGSASRSMIDNMNDIVWSINPGNDDFENILQRMQYFAAELSSAKNILLQFDTDENIKRIKLPMEKRKSFYLIYKEAINNACKYAESKNINVSIAEKDGSLVMIITDNGKGFDLVKNGLGGNGLKNMQARANEIAAKFEINSWPGKGTRVFLKMKV